VISSRDLYCQKFAFEDSKTPKGDLQVKEILETSTGPEPGDWGFPFINFIIYGILPDDPKEAAAIKWKAPWFYYNAITWTLYRWSYDEILLHCLSQKETQQALREAYDGPYGAHQPGPKLGDRLWRLSYYWPKMISNAIAYARWCHTCQIHGDFIHQAPDHLHPTSS